MDNLKITGASTALYSTWFFVEPWRLLLDCGDGVCASLGPKLRKIHHVGITHADRDHLTGLLQLNQLNARDGMPSIYYPKSCGSFPAMRDFCDRFDPEFAGEAKWRGVEAEEEVRIGTDLILRPHKNGHMPAELGQTKSLGFRVYRRKHRLKQEYRGLSGKEIAAIAQRDGRNAIHEAVDELLLGFSGDTADTETDLWQGCRVLIHEATFLNCDDARSQRARHSVLIDVLQMAKNTQVEKLILTHFSSRYNAEQIAEAVITQARSIDYRRPIWLVPPFRVVRDVLATVPLRPRCL